MFFWSKVQTLKTPTREHFIENNDSKHDNELRMGKKGKRKNHDFLGRIEESSGERTTFSPWEGREAQY